MRSVSAFMKALVVLLAASISSAAPTRWSVPYGISTSILQPGHPTFSQEAYI